MTVGLGIGGGDLSVGAAAWAQSAVADPRRTLGGAEPGGHLGPHRGDDPRSRVDTGRVGRRNRSHTR